MGFDRAKAPEICKKLIAGVDENVIAAYHGITLPELYNIVEVAERDIACTHLKHFCRGYINNVCLSWPNYDEHLCPVFGYEAECPLCK